MQWCSGGIVHIEKSEHEIDGIVTLIDSHGLKRLWPAPKCMADVEDLYVAHAIKMIDIQKIIISPGDFEVYNTETKKFGTVIVRGTGP